jgi:hypothetical protein
VGSVLVVSLGGAGRNTGELLADKADLILSSIEDRLRQHLGAAVAQAEYLKLSIEEGRIDVADPKVLEAGAQGRTRRHAPGDRNRLRHGGLQGRAGGAS